MLSVLWFVALPQVEASSLQNVRVAWKPRSRVISISGGTDTNYVATTVTSGAGTETVFCTESDAWLHGAATLPALPKTEGSLSLTLYDSSNQVLASYSGTLTAAGTVQFKNSYTKNDLSLLGTELYSVGSGYDLALDLSGAGTYDVAYADLEVLEKQNTCDKSGCTTTIKTSKNEVFWDEVGAVWTGDLKLAHVGIPAISSTSYDRAGKKLDTVTVSVAPHFIDDWQSETALVSDDDPLTSVTFENPVFLGSTGALNNTLAMSVVSEGWLGTAPVDALVELDNGSSIVVPVSSYQVGFVQALGSAWDSAVANAKDTPQLSVIEGVGTLLMNDSSYYSLGDLSRPVCIKGTCIALNQNEKGAWELAVTGYATTVSGLASTATVTLILTDSTGTKLASQTVNAQFDSEITAFFVNDMIVSQDPFGLDLSGKVSLRSAADKKGKQSTLSKGKFYGQFSINEDGSLGIAGADKGSVISRGDIVTAGKPVSVEMADTNGDGVISGPPSVVLMTTSNGKGTRNVATANTAKPGLL